MKKRTFLWVLAACMLVIQPALVMAGGQKAQTQNTATGSKEGWFAGRNFSEHLNIDHADVYVDESLDFNNGDVWVKQWTSDFNVTMNIIALTGDTWRDRLRIWINSDDAPDVSNWDYNHGEAVNYVEQGMVKRLPDNWKTKYPNLAKTQKDVPMSAMLEDLFGGTYFLPRPIFSTNKPTERISDQTSIYIRKDWARAAGAEVKEAMKLSELVDLARKIKAADPGRVGPSFAPIVISKSSIYSQFARANNENLMPYYWDSASSSYKWGAAAPETLTSLKILSAAYREGLIDQQFYTMQIDDNLGYFWTTGQSAITATSGMAFRMQEIEQHLQADLGVNYDTAVEVIPLLGEDGNYHATQSLNYWGAVIFSPHISDAKMERYLSMMDYSCTEEGQLRLRMGIKGVDWDTGNNGALVSKLSPGTSLADKYAIDPVYSAIMILHDDFQFINPSYKAAFRNKTKELYEIRQKYATPQTFPLEPDYNVIFHSSRAASIATLEYNDEFAALIVKPGDIEANWRAWVNEKMPLIQPVLDELTASRKR
jgi:putative aldouronate transport system substrate-binding protein